MQRGQKLSPENCIKVNWSVAWVGSALLLLGVHLLHGQYRRADPDEFQSIINAVLVFRGHQLYADFWDNHGPVLTWLLVPLLKLSDGSYELLPYLRGVMWINTLALCFLVFSFTRVLTGDRSRLTSCRISGLAVLLLLISPPFLIKSIEFRPDNPANLAAFGSMYMLYQGLNRMRRRYFLVAGLCLGIMFGFTLKAAMFTVSLIIFTGIYCIAAKRNPRVPEVVFFAGGIALPLLTMIGILQLDDLLEPFLRCYFTENVQRNFPGFTSSELTEILQKAPVWSCMVLGVISLTLWKAVKGKAEPIEVALAAVVLTLLLQFALLLPTKYYQSLLTVYPPLAVLTSLAVMRVLEKRRFRRIIIVWATPVVGLLLVSELAWFNDLRNTALRRQVTFAEQASALIPPDAFVFDPSGILYFSPRSGYYPILVKYIRRGYQDGQVNAGVIDQLQRASAVVMDKRTLDLPPGDLDIIKTRFTMRLKGPGHDLWTVSPARD